MMQKRIASHANYKKSRPLKGAGFAIFGGNGLSMNRETRKRLPEGLEVRAQVRSNSFDPETRTFEVTFATGTPVTRFDWEEWETFDEVLEVSTKAMRMERLASGAPFLKDHRNSVDNVIGRIERAWVEGGEGKAVIRLSKRAELDAIAQDLADGIIGNVSVGYRVHRYDKGKKGESQARATYVATDWEPMEISLVGIPADHKSTMRSGSSEPHFVTIIEEIMENNPQNPKAPETRTAEDLARAAQEAAKAERERITTISELCRKADLADDFAKSLIEAGESIEMAQRKIIDKWAERGAPPITNTAPNTSVVQDHEHQARMEGLELAIGLRYGGLDESQLKPEEITKARPYRDKRLMDLARESLMRTGVSPSAILGMTSDEIVGRAITSNSSDFPIALEGTARRVLLAAYQSVPDVWREFCRVGSNPDYRDSKRLRGGALGNLYKLNENGEYKSIAINDAEHERTRVNPYGMMLSITRTMIINDDLNFFADLATQMGRSAARTIETTVFEALVDNSFGGPKLLNGDTVFSATHGNIIAAGPMTTAKLIEARNFMSRLKDPNDKDYIGINPAILLCAVEQADQARLLIEAQYDTADNKFQKPNLVRGLVSKIIATPRLQATDPYYLFAAPNFEPVFELTFLNGQQSPRIESRESFSTDGMKWKIGHDFGFNAIGWRGGIQCPVQ